jgi:hypothetical protein
MLGTDLSMPSPNKSVLAHIELDINLDRFLAGSISCIADKCVGFLLNPKTMRAYVVNRGAMQAGRKPVTTASHLKSFQSRS